MIPKIKKKFKDKVTENKFSLLTDELVPCKDDLIYWLDGSRDEDSTGYISRYPGVDDREVLQAGSMKFDGTAYGQFASFPWSNFTDGIKVECYVEATSSGDYVFFSAGLYNNYGIYLWRKSAGFDITANVSGAHSGLYLYDASTGVTAGDIVQVSFEFTLISGNQYTLDITIGDYTTSATVNMDYSGSYTCDVARYSGGGLEFPGKINDLKLYQGSNLIAYIPGVVGSGTTAANVIDADNPLNIVNQPSDFWYSHSDGFGSNYLNDFGYSERENLSGDSEDLTGSTWATLLGATISGPNTFNLDLTGKSRIENTASMADTTLAGETIEMTVELSGPVGAAVHIGIAEYTTWDVTYVEVTLTDTLTEYTVSRTLGSGATGALFRVTNFSGVTINGITFGKIHATKTGGEYAKTTSFSIVGKQPAAYQGDALDWLGNDLQSVGKVKPTLPCYKAPAFVGDGVAYGTLSSFPWSNFTDGIKVECDVEAVGSGPFVIIGAGLDSTYGFYIFRTSTYFAVSCAQAGSGAGYIIYDSVSGVTVGDIVRLSFEFTLISGNQYVIDITVGNYTTSTTKYMDYSSVYPLYVSRYTGGGLYFPGKIHDLKLYQGGELINAYSFTEGTPTETALKTYDRIGSNHITWTSMSATNWQLVERPDWPLLDGFSKRENQLKQSEDITASPWFDQGTVNSMTDTGDGILIDADIYSGRRQEVSQSYAVDDYTAGSITVTSEYSWETYTRADQNGQDWVVAVEAKAGSLTTLRLGFFERSFGKLQALVSTVGDSGTFYVRKMLLKKGTTFSESDYIKTTDTPAIGYQPASQTDVNKDAAGNALQYLPGQTMVGKELGAELLVNGDFEDSTTGWGASDATIDASSGELVVTASGSNPLAYQTITGLTAGSSFFVECSIISSSGSAVARVVLYNEDWSIAGGYTSGERATIIITGSYIRVQLKAYGGSVGDTATFDNISIKEILTDSINPMEFKAPLYQPHISQESDIGANLWFDGAGGQNALTFGDLDTNWNDANFYGDNKYLIYESAITGTCKTKTEEYIG